MPGFIPSNYVVYMTTVVLNFLSAPCYSYVQLVLITDCNSQPETESGRLRGSSNSECEGRGVVQRKKTPRHANTGMSHNLTLLDRPTNETLLYASQVKYYYLSTLEL